MFIYLFNLPPLTHVTCRHCSKCFTNNTKHHLIFTITYEVGMSIISTLQIRKLRTQTDWVTCPSFYTTSKQQSSNQCDILAPESSFCITMLSLQKPTKSTSLTPKLLFFPPYNPCMAPAASTFLQFLLTVHTLSSLCLNILLHHFFSLLFLV